MECQECHQRPATLHLQQIINGNKREVQVCEICAKEIGYVMAEDEGYSLHNLLAGLFNFDSSQLTEPNKQEFKATKVLECAKCKLTFTEFKRSGKFGCANCYQVFQSQLDPIFRRVHSGNTQHNGKIPMRIGGDLHKKRKLSGYKMQLKQLIQNEAFEQAAIVRDQIKALEKKVGNQSAGDDK